MALRSLDNALPISPQRPKKIAKVDTAKTETPRLVNDENAGVQQPNTVDVSVEYIASCDLKPLADPETRITRLLEDLDSKDWTKVCEALNDVRRIALHHSSLLHPVLQNVLMVLVKAMKNPRSALCKTSIMTSTDVFRSFGDKLLPTTTKEDAFDQLLLQLLLKASQDKKFVCEEAANSLHEMASFLPAIPLLKKLQCYVKHANLKVRAKAAVSISNCTSKMDDGAMKEYGLENLLLVAASLLNDRLPEARESARNIVNEVHQAFLRARQQENGQPAAEVVNSWEEFYSSNLSPTSAQSIAKIVLQ